MNVYKPGINDLHSLKREATHDGTVSDADWLRKMCGTMAKVLDGDPRSYRSFGPYWWIVKKELLDAGYNQFGDFLDREWLEIMDYGDPVWNLLAGWLYQDHALNNGMIYANGHPIVVTPDEPEGAEPEDRVYTLADEDMEALSITGGI